MHLQGPDRARYLGKTWPVEDPDAGRNDDPSERVVEQRVRNQIVEYLELASSFAAQVEYERAAPIAHVPYEVINQWEDWLPQGLPTVNNYPGVWTNEEIEALNRFHVVWHETADAVPDDYPSLHAVQGMPAWKRLRSEADAALAVFARRGKLAEDREGA